MEGRCRSEHHEAADAERQHAVKDHASEASSCGLNSDSRGVASEASACSSGGEARPVREYAHAVFASAWAVKLLSSGGMASVIPRHSSSHDSPCRLSLASEWAVLATARAPHRRRSSSSDPVVCSRSGASRAGSR